MTLPKPPREVPYVSSLDGLAPKFRAAVLAVLAEIPDAIVIDSTRTPERQAYLYGFGRTYDDGRGIVTQARTHLTSWHGYGLAADIVSRAKGWNVGYAWFEAMGRCAIRHGCDWGGSWANPDLPHIQWGRCKPAPSDEARRLMASGGARAVWAAVGAL